MPLKKLLLYYHTLKYLKPQQFWFRFVRAAFPLKRSSFPMRTIPKVHKFQKKWKQVLPINACIVSENPLTFSFLNQTHPIKNQEDWNRVTADKLWLYTLHYHPFLLSEADLSLKKSILLKWIEQNPWPIGIAWEPYPLSLRIVNWIKFALSEQKAADDIFLKSLFLQCLSLEKQIEYHLLGNHLFENAKALFFAGIFFDTGESRRWLKKGLSLLDHELKEQILADGGHFERSPMYHGIILEGLLDVYQLISISGAPAFEKLSTSKNPAVMLNSFQHLIENIRKILKQVQDDVPCKGVFRGAQFETRLRNLIPHMIQWFSSLTHPDGQIAFFNDSTLEIGPTVKDIQTYASTLGLPSLLHKRDSIYLKESGFARAERGKALLLADIGSVGPSYLPGHAHAGTLSFELSLGNERLLVNSGISTYTVGKERAYQRSTLAHNTLSIDGQNSSEVWSSFRVGKRASVRDVQFSPSNKGFSAAHDGYQRSKYRLIHQREWSLKERKITLTDSLTGKGIPEVTASFHLHPAWSIVSYQKSVLKIQSLQTQQEVKVRFPEDATLKIEPYDYALGFNKTQKSHCIRVCLSNMSLPSSHQTTIEW